MKCIKCGYAPEIQIIYLPLAGRGGLWFVAQLQERGGTAGSGQSRWRLAAATSYGLGKATEGSAGTSQTGQTPKEAIPKKQ